MKVTYDPEVDVLRIVLSGTPIEESDESKPGIILDYDKAGNVVGMEILDASRRTDNPQTMEYAIARPAGADPTSVLIREKPAAKYGARSLKAKPRQG
ncbi:MAG: DUF2283 domain-containing protein [Lentisphaerae bacterium]|nr:DUF2283 domain-containing protein [Lentisphaerota bacterium]